MPEYQALQQNLPYYVAYEYFTLLCIGQSSLLPFLSLFFKHLGLPPLHVGLLRGLYTFLGCCAATIWISLATRYSKQSYVTVLALFLCVATYNVFSVVPPLPESQYQVRCAARMRLSRSNSTNNDSLTALPVNGTERSVSPDEGLVATELDTNATHRRKLKSNMKEGEQMSKTPKGLIFSRHKKENSTTQWLEKNMLNESLKPRKTKKKALYYQMYAHASFNPAENLLYRKRIKDWMGDEAREYAALLINASKTLANKDPDRANNSNFSSNRDSQAESAKNPKDPVPMSNSAQQGIFKGDGSGNDNSIDMHSNEAQASKLIVPNEWNYIDTNNDRYDMPGKVKEQRFPRNNRKLFRNKYDLYTKYLNYWSGLPLNYYKSKYVSKRNSIDGNAYRRSQAISRKLQKRNFQYVYKESPPVDSKNDLMYTNNQKWRRRSLTSFNMQPLEYPVQPDMNADDPMLSQDLNYPTCNDCFDGFPAKNPENFRRISKMEPEKQSAMLPAGNIVAYDDGDDSKSNSRKDAKMANQTEKANQDQGSNEVTKSPEIITESEEEVVKNPYSFMQSNDVLHLFPFLSKEEILQSGLLNHSSENPVSTVSSKTAESETTLRIKLAVNDTTPLSNNNGTKNSTTKFSKKIPMLVFLYTFTVISGVFESAGYSHASATWYTYLDENDEVEDFEIHRWVGLLLASVVTFILGVIIVQCPCRVPPSVDWFQLNVLFYSVCIFVAAVAFTCFTRAIKTKVMALCPTMYVKRVLNLFSGGNVTIAAMTLILSSMWSASVQEFLLWTVEDLGGNGYHFGGTVAVGLMSEMLAPSITKALTNRFPIQKCLIAFSFLQAIQLFYFAGLWAPGFVFFGQMLHGCFAAIRQITFDIVMKQTHPALNFQVQITINYLVCGVGITLGSILGGILYSSPTGSGLYQNEGIIALIWSFILTVLCHFWVKSPQDSYEELQTQDPIDRAAALSVVESDTDDDWLEEALKKNAIKQSGGVNFTIESPDLHPADD